MPNKMSSMIQRVGYVLSVFSTTVYTSTLKRLKKKIENR